MIRAAHSCKCENNNLRPGYLRSAVVVFTGITWPAAACHLLLFHFRRKHHVHLLAVEPGHRLHFGELFEIGGKAQQQDFALLLEDDRTAAEEDVSLDFGPLLEEVLRVLEFEIVVVVVGLGPEADLLHDHFRLIGLQFLGFLLLLVKEFLVIVDAAYGEISIRSSSSSSASLSASRIGRTCGWPTLSPTTRTSGAVISLLIRWGFSLTGGRRPKRLLALAAGFGLLFPGVNGLGGNGFGAAIVVRIS